MDPVIDQLRKIIELSHYINSCPTTCRKEVIQAERDVYRNSLRDQQSNPEIELRWLTFNLKMEEGNLQYLKAAYKCEQHIPADHLRQQKDIIKDKNQLPRLIKQQHELIFSKCLLESTSLYLEDNTDANVPFSADDILSKAFHLYKKRMLKEYLCQFEIISLIERYDFLSKKKTESQSNLKDNHITIIESTDPELNFIECMLNTTDLTSLKLQATNSLCAYLKWEDPNQLTPDSLKEKIDEYIKDEGDKNIDPKLLVQHNEARRHAIKLRKISLYFNTVGNTTVADFLSQSMSTIDTFTQHIQLPTQTDQTTTITTTDKRIHALRKTVEEYRKNLAYIELNESRTFTNRSAVSLKKREQALTTLETCISRADTLTPNIKAVITSCVSEIKANKPSWSELAFIDKILDIISLGLHALIRLGAFKEHPSAISLEENAKNNNPSIDS